MLNQLSIKNIALIESEIIEFNDGFNVISGETGAGKSIIIDALNLVLGERADKELVRNGEQRAKVEGIFSVDNQDILSMLEENDIETNDGTLIITREISLDGKSICRINGTAVTLSFLKKVADKLADIHGQHEHQLLLNKDTHIDFLDDFAGEELFEQKENVKRAYTYYKSCLEQLNGDWGTEEERRQKIDFLQFTVDELEQAQVVVGQEEELIAKREMLKNVDLIKDALYNTSQEIKGGALDNVRSASKILDNIADKGYSELAERLESVFYELEDIASTAEDSAENVEADPYELERIEERISQLKKLYRKYAPDEEGLIKVYNDSQEELERLSNAEETIAELNRQAEKFKAEYEHQAEILTAMRHDASIEFEDAIKEELTQLGMKNARLEVEFGDEVFTANGKDNIEFLFSANAGEDVKPLNKTISGGEMSRFMLGVKSIQKSKTSTMVFDEIDTGISGEGASVVAQKMARIAKNSQIIVITHLPQIASMADEHFVVKKHSDGVRTVSEIHVCDLKMRRIEIARLSGGNETELALWRADEIIDNAIKFKSQI